MEKISIYVILVFFLNFTNALCQDERLFRDLMGQKEKKPFKESILQKSVHWHVISPFYEVEMDGFPGKESFRVEKRDGEDWFSLFNQYKEKIFSKKLDGLGKGSKVFRVSLRVLSKNLKTLIVYFYNGFTDVINFEGTGRLYFFTWEDNNLKTLNTFKGPAFWHEFSPRNGHYHRRVYELSLYDSNGDGTKEIIVKHGPTTKLFFYKKKKGWRRF